MFTTLEYFLSFDVLNCNCILLRFHLSFNLILFTVVLVIFFVGILRVLFIMKAQYLFHGTLMPLNLVLVVAVRAHVTIIIKEDVSGALYLLSMYTIQAADIISSVVFVFLLNHVLFLLKFAQKRSDTKRFFN